ncbi:MAG: hypothetical protein IH595_13790 [Bacteroidales bacterium]|nr:hypothetical protein [Bacteroidales bacterium]
MCSYKITKGYLSAAVGYSLATGGYWSVTGGYWLTVAGKLLIGEGLFLAGNGQQAADGRLLLPEKINYQQVPDTTVRRSLLRQKAGFYLPHVSEILLALVAALFNRAMTRVIFKFYFFLLTQKH